MRADRDTLEARLDRIRRATDAIDPPPSLAAEVMARAASAPSARSGRVTAAWWAQLGPVGRSFVPVAMLAAAAAVALAWSGQATLDETATSALDIAQDLP